MCDPSAEDLTQQAVQDHGLFLVRQERWTDLSNAMNAADRDRETTLDGMTLAICWLLVRDLT